MRERLLSLVALGIAPLGCSVRDPGSVATDAGEPTDTGQATDSDTGSAAPLPDIDLSGTAALVHDSMWTTHESFAADHCALMEGCVAQPGERRLLRFSTYVPNVGTADFVIGSPLLDPTAFEWSACHEHWHFSGFAVYRLLDTDGAEVASGHKRAFALMDTAQWLIDAGPGKYPLADGTQGISVGWVDVYLAWLDCQWIDITDVPPGDYQLEIVINPDGRVAERDELDNVLTIPVTLTDIDSGPPDIPATWTCSTAAYGLDQCNCGCGAFDPDCHNPTAEACEVCNAPGSCAEGEPDCSSIAPNDNSMCG
jgi:hypothetical protein